ncbi:Uncharacterised protein [uncultured archaeon]|nr:Uncharacterised protein [uncultured archaeon]
MYPAVLLAIASMLLVYSLYLCRKIIPLIDWPYMKKSWRLRSFLMFLFLAGYVSYLYILSFSVAHELNDLLLSAFLFSGAVFIMIAMRSGYQLLDGLKTSEVNIVLDKRTLERDQGAIDKMRIDLENKNEEMDKLLAEVYALRQILEKRYSTGKQNFESKRMAILLEELKKNLNAKK